MDGVALWVRRPECASRCRSVAQQAGRSLCEDSVIEKNKTAGGAAMLRTSLTPVRQLRRCSSHADGGLADRMQRELGALFTGSAVEPPPIPGRKGARADTGLSGMRRKMPDHELPPYAEANFRTLTFVMARAPRLADFPRETVYRRDSIDLLFRHYYKRP